MIIDLHRYSLPHLSMENLAATYKGNWSLLKNTNTFLPLKKLKWTRLVLIWSFSHAHWPDQTSFSTSTIRAKPISQQLTNTRERKRRQKIVFFFPSFVLFSRKFRKEKPECSDTQATDTVTTSKVIWLRIAAQLFILVQRSTREAFRAHVPSTAAYADEQTSCHRSARTREPYKCGPYNNFIMKTNVSRLTNGWHRRINLCTQIRCILLNGPDADE